MTDLFADTAPDAYGIDLRHRKWIESVLMSGKYRRVLEIGSWKGYSTVAFLKALDAGKIDELHVVEPKPQLELHWRIASAKEKDRVHLHETKSVKFLDECKVPFDLAFVDGDHSSEAVLGELKRLVPAKIPVLFFHDVCAANFVSNCGGPQYAVQQLQSAGYLGLLDALHRPDEWTHRGLYGAAKTLQDYHTLLGAYCESCG
jgi:hypothetical protein